MPAKDMYHNIVKNALIKAGWKITDDPLVLQFGETHLYADLGAEQMIAAQKNSKTICVEIKSFLQESFMSEFHTAVGQFIHYRLILKEKDPTHIVYLDVPSEVYNSFFKLQLTQASIKANRIKYFVSDVKKEVIVKWKS
jgi:hypothetical protein